MEYILLLLILVFGYLFVHEKVEERKKIPFCDTYSKLK